MAYHRSIVGSPRSGRRRPAARVGALLLGLGLALGSCAPVAPPRAAPEPRPAPTPIPWDRLDDEWGPYLAERQWGNPREAIRAGDGWSMTYEETLTTPYRFGDDGIAGITDRRLDVAFAFAFYRPGEPWLTERLHGLSNPAGKYGETILEDRTFHENTPTHSYLRYRYRYPFEGSAVESTIEHAKRDPQALVTRVTLEAVEGGPGGAVHLVPQVWLPPGREGRVERLDERSWLAVHPAGNLAVIADRRPDGWQITGQRGAINEALVEDGRLRDAGEGDRAAWEFVVHPRPGTAEVLRFGIVNADDPEAARDRARELLATADELLSARRAEAAGLYVDEVSEHRAVYQAALMHLLWNKMYYAYDGSYEAEWAGRLDARDVILVPDRWEFPWPAMWDTCFQAAVAALADPELARRDLRLFLGPRWQQPDGHVPNVEWHLDGETPPLFAWAALELYRADRDRSFLEELFPRLEMHYRWLRQRFDGDGDGLHAGGFMGMDNIPRPGPPDAEQADLSGWMALMAESIARIAAEIGEEGRTSFYRRERERMIAEINAQLWDEDDGFYYDRNRHGFERHKSYGGLIPFLAGAPDEERSARILEQLRNPEELWTPFGIRSLSARSILYEPGHSVTGWKNSNWRGPIWLPINYLLVRRLEEVEPELAERLRRALIGNVEKQWRATGRFWEYYDAESGEGRGADHQTGWTALVANLIRDRYGN